MSFIKKFISANPYFFLIIIVGLFFRVYRLDHLFPFAFDEDLISWIVKDIWIDHHIRLIGQLTSIMGVFIGPLFYYLLVPFYAISNMDPSSTIIFSVITGLTTIISIYFIFNSFFNKTTALIGSFIYAVSVNIILYDRWIVPTMFVPLWSVWFLYILFCIQKGDYKKFWILGILVGLIWHIHLALLPLISLIPIALILTNKRPKIKSFILLCVFAFILLLPFFVFELRHNFQQTSGILDSFGKSIQEAEGLHRLTKIIDASSIIMIRSLTSYWPLPTPFIYLFLAIGILFLKFKKILDRYKIIVILFWFLVIIFTQELSKRGVSEYYFASLIILPILIFSLVLKYFNDKYFGKKIILVFTIFYFFFNLINFSKFPGLGESFFEKVQAVNFIVADAKAENYSCIQLNFMTDPGNEGGFRYLFWWKNMQLIKTGNLAPVYSIVIPWNKSPKESNPVFGSIGIIRPTKQTPLDEKICNDPKNHLDPLFGFYN